MASVHPVFDARAEPQVLVWIANGPVTLSDVSGIDAVPVFEIVTCCAVETVDTCRSPKFTLLGRRTIADCVVQVPDRLTVSCPLAMLPGTVNVPVRVPEVEGSNVTDI